MFFKSPTKQCALRSILAPPARACKPISSVETPSLEVTLEGTTDMMPVLSSSMSVKYGAFIAMETERINGAFGMFVGEGICWNSYLLRSLTSSCNRLQQMVTPCNHC